MLFTYKNNKFTLLKDKSTLIEKDLQSMIEKNLEKIFGLRFVKSEYPIGKGKIDTLAHDPAGGAFCIIEYKKEKSITLFDQGLTYLNLLLQNKDAVRAAYNDTGTGAETLIFFAG